MQNFHFVDEVTQIDINVIFGLHLLIFINQVYKSTGSIQQGKLRLRISIFQKYYDFKIELTGSTLLKRVF